MSIHPATSDGYFVAGNPLTGDRPAGSIPSLDFFNALLDLIDISTVAPVTVTTNTTLTAAQYIVFATPATGTTITITLPVYASVPAGKRYKVVNLGAGTVQINSADSKTVDGSAYLQLSYLQKSGDIVKYSSNWRTA